MKKYVFALIGFAAAAGSPLLAQTAAPAVGGVAVVMAAPECGACCPTRTTCVPERYMKKTTKVVYSSGCEPVCLCYFRGLSRNCGCESGHCEQPYTRHYLIKKNQTCEECATKCVPSQCPVCEHGHCGVPVGCAAAVVPASPAPPMAAPPAITAQPAR